MYESNYFSTRQNTVICSIDLKKAYDNVNHDLLFKKLEKLNIPKYLINLIKDIYKNTTMQKKKLLEKHQAAIATEEVFR